jgi:hypothetical protein
MFDSENVSLVTRIEAGDGVVVSFRTNSDGENVYTASVDQAWLGTWINSNASSALTLNATDEARILALETKLGITTTTTPTPTVPTAGTSGTTEVVASASGATLTGELVMIYNIVGIDGTAVVSETFKGSAGMTPGSVVLAMYAQMKRNSATNLYLTPTADAATGKLTVTWKDSAVGSTISYNVASQGAGDNFQLIVTDY